jgi:hypothetical protein
MCRLYPCTTVHPSFVKLVTIISCLIQAYHMFRRRRSSPSSTHASLEVHVPTCTPLPIPRTPSPPVPSRLYITPLSSSSTLVNSRESLISTVGGNDYEEAVPPRPDTPLPPGDFDFESEDEEEELPPAAVQFAEHINSKIRANQFFIPPLRKRFRWTRQVHRNITISSTRLLPHTFPYTRVDW